MFLKGFLFLNVLRGLRWSTHKIPIDWNFIVELAMNTLKECHWYKKKKFSCWTLEKPILKKQVVIGKEQELYSGGGHLGRRKTLVQETTLRFLAGPKIFKGASGQFISKRGAEWNTSWLHAGSVVSAADYFTVLRGHVLVPQGEVVQEGCFQAYLGNNAWSIDLQREV